MTPTAHSRVAATAGREGEGEAVGGNERRGAGEREREGRGSVSARTSAEAADVCCATSAYTRHTEDAGGCPP